MRLDRFTDLRDTNGKFRTMVFDNLRDIGLLAK